MLRTWSTALACAACQALGMSLVGIYSFYVTDVANEFSLPYSQANLGIPIIFITGALCAPLLGILIDRIPIKPILLLGISLAMGSLYALSQATSVTQLLLFFVILSVGISMYGPVATNSLLVKTYHTDRARALAIAAMGTSVSSVALPLIIGWLLIGNDWRASLVMLAAGIWVFTTLVVLAGVSSSMPGGDEPAGDSADHENEEDNARGFLRTPAFWFIGVGFALIFNVSTINAFCLVPHLASYDFELSLIAKVSAMGGVCGFIGKMAFAIISDRIKHFVKPVLLVLVALQFTGWLVMTNVSAVYLPFIALGLLGFTAGICLPMQPFVTSVYFGEKSIGQVVGAQTPLMLPLGIAAAPLAGIVFDRTDSYVLVFQVAAALILLAALLFMALPAPQEKQPLAAS